MDGPSDAETGLIAACLAPYWDADWGLIDIVAGERDYGAAGGLFTFEVRDDLTLRRLLHILEKHRDAYPFGVTFSLTHYDLAGARRCGFRRASSRPLRSRSMATRTTTGPPKCAAGSPISTRPSVRANGHKAAERPCKPLIW